MVIGFAGEVYAKLAEDARVHVGEDDAGVYLGTLEVLELFKRSLCNGIGGSADGKRDQNLIRVKSGIFVAKVIDLKLLDRFDNGRGEKQNVILDACQNL